MVELVTLSGDSAHYSVYHTALSSVVTDGPVNLLLENSRGTLCTLRRLGLKV